MSKTVYTYYNADGSIAYTDEKVVEVMNQWKDMLDKGYFSAPMTNVDMEYQVLIMKSLPLPIIHWFNLFS